MSTRWQIVFQVVAVMIIGIVIGALLNRALIQKRLRDMIEMRGAGLREPRPEKILKPADAEQEAKIQAVLDKHVQKLSEIHQRFSGEIDAAFKSLKEEIDPILTPEQKKEFEKMIPGSPPEFGRPPRFPGGPPRSPGRMPGRPAGLRGGFPIERIPFSAEFELATLKAELNLSEDQAASIKTILDQFISQTQTLSEKGFSPENFDSLKQAEEKKEEEIGKILSAEQKEKYKQVKSRMFEKPSRPIPPA